MPHDPGSWGPPYRYGFSIVWRKLANCVHWWSEYLGVERGRGVVMQYRVHSFRQWPVSVSFYRAEPPKNVYDDHPLMIDSGTFWRCDHGWTGYGDGFVWLGCWRCAVWRPIEALKRFWYDLLRG